MKKNCKVLILATSRVIELLTKSGFPEGVVNLVNGTGQNLLRPLCSSNIPRLLTCIGSTAMGRRVIENSPDSTVKRFSLELGGDAPVLFFADCPDLKSAVAEIVELKFSNAGQICVSPNRVFVQEKIYEEVVTICKALAEKFTFGSGKDEGEHILQPLASAQALKSMDNLVQDAISKGE